MRTKQGSKAVYHKDSYLAEAVRAVARMHNIQTDQGKEK